MPLLSHVAAPAGRARHAINEPTQPCGGKKLCEPDGRHPGRYGLQTHTSYLAFNKSGACCHQTRRSAVRPPGRCDHPPVASRGWPDHHGTHRITTGHRRVDTHKDLHVAAARDQLGRRLATTTTTTRAGYAQLLGWALGLGEPAAWGVEGTGSYGAGLARFLATHGQRVVEVNRPDRAARRRHGKSDPLDADAAAAPSKPARRPVSPRPPMARWR
jgi:Transposase